MRKQITLWTDGAASEEKGRSAYAGLCVDNSSFHFLIYDCVDAYLLSNEIEGLAVSKSLEEILNRGYTNTDIIVRSDNFYIIFFIRRFLDGTLEDPETLSPTLQTLYKNLEKARKAGNTISAKKVRGHKGIPTANSVVDSYAKLALRGETL